MQNKAIFGPASPKQAMMMSNQAQILVIGGAAGSGKSYILQLLPLFIIDDPHSNIVMLRRTTPQIVGQGGIWDTAKGIYTQLPQDIRPKIREKALEAVFPSGAKVAYRHMERVADKLNFQGLIHVAPLFRNR